VATTVTLGSVAWPVLRRAGYPPNPGGGVLSAAGIGAILSPPTLGAAAFIIAEFLEISYLQVLLFATIPTLLYFLGISLAIEMGSRRYGTRGVDIDTKPLDAPAGVRLPGRRHPGGPAGGGGVRRRRGDRGRVSLTGLGLKGSSLIVGAAGGTLVLPRSTRPWWSLSSGWPCR